VNVCRKIENLIISAAWNSIKALPQNNIVLFIAEFLNAILSINIAAGYDSGIPVNLL
jgi:hypothetical protein